MTDDDTLDLVSALDDALPQTQCTRCGYPDCRSYAKAVAAGAAAINRCPPGGQEGIERLAWLTGRPATPLDPACGAEVPRQLAVIDEAACIGCTLCLAACPVDCIVGGAKHLHTVIEAHCTGCELCVPACPVDCISLRSASGDRTGWQAWSPAQAVRSRGRHAERLERLCRDDSERQASRSAPGLSSNPVESAAATNLTNPAPDTVAARRATIEAVLARARSARRA